MSGGRWGYQQDVYRAQAEEMKRTLRLLAEIEHACDWSESCDWDPSEGPAIVYRLCLDFFDGAPARTAYEVRAELKSLKTRRNPL